jgi:hypothetical protein
MKLNLITTPHIQQLELKLVAEEDETETCDPTPWQLNYTSYSSTN